MARANVKLHFANEWLANCKQDNSANEWARMELEREQEAKNLAGEAVNKESNERRDE